MWAWAFDRPERFPGVPAPRRISGGTGDADKLSPPEPVVALGAPSWQDVDAMIGQLQTEWHRRVATLMRFTGLRASHACGVDWRDIDLERGVLHVRAGVLGAKRSRARVIPLAPHLANHLREWGPGTGLLFPWRSQGGKGEVLPKAHTGAILVKPFRRAWEKAGVSRDKWDIPDSNGPWARGKGSPTHAIRRCIRTELIRAGVEEAIVLYLIGQSQGITAAAYVPESSPEYSPYWPRLVDAVGRIPDVGEQPSG